MKKLGVKFCKDIMMKVQVNLIMAIFATKNESTGELTCQCKTPNSNKYIASIFTSTSCSIYYYTCIPIGPLLVFAVIIFVIFHMKKKRQCKLRRMHDVIQRSSSSPITNFIRSVASNIFD